MLVRGQCPNCGGTISDERLTSGLACENCLPTIPQELRSAKFSRIEFLRELCKILSITNKCKGYRKILEEEEELLNFEDFFEKAIGSKPWSAQKMWARRIFRGYSFAILAPTGVGKSVFGIVMSLFLASRGKKSYILLPTSVLVKQTLEKLQECMRAVGINVKVIAYLTSLGKVKEEILSKIEQGDFDVLITTSQFLSRNFDIIKNRKFDFVFVDDVDAVMKSSKNIEKILILLGFSEEIIQHTLKLVRAIITNRSKDEIRDILKEREKLRKILAEIDHGTLVVSTATGRPRGLRVKLFRELLGFEIGSRAELLRNVVDAYVIHENEHLYGKVAEIVAKLGKGGLIFIQPGTSEEQINELLALLESKGIKARLITSKSKRELEAFERGEFDALVGFATYYGLLVRGLDLPHVIRYAVFVDVPHFRFSASVEEASPLRLLQLAQVARNVTAGGEASSLDKLVSTIRRYLANLDQASYLMLSESLNTGKRPEGFLGFLYDRLQELRSSLRVLLSKEELLKELQVRSLASIKIINGKPHIILPDAPTYLQASGRTSRLYAGGISKGLSVVVTNDRNLLEALIKQVRWYVEDTKWISFDKLHLDKIIFEIDKDREIIRDLRSGRARKEFAELVKTALVVVESPTKARTIAAFFGKPSRRRIGNLPVYEVSSGGLQLLIAASKGHVLDLVTDEGFYGVKVNGTFTPVYTSIKRCMACGEQFTEVKNGACPRCGSTNISDQAEVIEALQKVASEVDLVLLATDPDTEGEKIAWDLYCVLAPYTGTLKRIEFHEITRRAFEEALRSPRDVDLRRVEAQLIRRIEDRWLGFTLSRKLWERFGMRWLSAGRVQTPVLGWVIEQFEEAKKSIKTIFRVTLDNGLKVTFESDLSSADARKLAKELKSAVAVIEVIGSEKVKLAPPSPYSTDSMLRDAVEVLGLSTEEVMRLAQDLFELGLITYHRTDSTHVSALGISIAKTYIAERFGDQMFVARAWGQPGAHECIRPTRPHDMETLRALVSQGIMQLARPLTAKHYRLYDLIFRRFIASQMADAVVKVERLRTIVGPFTRELTTYADVLSPGFTRIYQPFVLLKIEPGTYKVVDVRHRKIPTAKLHSQADLVAKMKVEGIGRPSTYAKIIETLIERKYVIETKRHRLVPTELGIKVYNYLKENFGNMISVERTRFVENLMDKVENGEANYTDVLRMLYEEVLKIG